jgi:hypothetical protein
MKLQALNVSNAYADKITLDSSVTLTGTSFIVGGFFQGGSGISLTFDSGGGGAGTLQLSGTTIGVDVVIKQPGSSATIDSGVWLLTLDNFGTVTWTTGSLTLGSTTNEAGATFDMAGDQDLIDAGGLPGLSTFVNKGTLKKSAGAAGAQTRFGVDLENQGTLSVIAGTLNFTASASQTGANAKTYLWSGTTIQAANPFTISGGLFYGEGTVEGSMNVTGGTVHPGITDGTAGTLTVKGNYTQGASGNLLIEYTAAGTGMLAVQADAMGMNGQASVAGKVTIRKTPGFNPPSQIPGVQFMSWITWDRSVTFTPWDGIGNVGFGQPGVDTWQDPVTGNIISYRTISISANAPGGCFFTTG